MSELVQELERGRDPKVLAEQEPRLAMEPKQALLLKPQVLLQSGSGPVLELLVLLTDLVVPATPVEGLLPLLLVLARS